MPSEGLATVTGGKAGAGDGYFVEPTIFANPSADAAIVREEIFGPVLVATPFDDVEEVIRTANDTRYGLTRSSDRAQIAGRHGVDQYPWHE